MPTRALLNQWLTELSRFYSGPIGCLGDGRQDVQQVTVATFESAFRWMPRLGNRFDLLVVNEAHHFGCGVRDEALEMCIATRRLGLSATPPGGPALARLEELLGPVVYQLGVGDLIGKWLADFDLVLLRVALDHPWLRALLDEYERGVGSRQNDLLARLKEPLTTPAPKAKQRFAVDVLQRLTDTRAKAAVPPSEARWAALTAAAASAAAPREAVLSLAAEQLGTDVESLEAALFSDLRSERGACALPAGISPERLASEVNLRLVKSWLQRARVVRIQAGQYAGARQAGTPARTDLQPASRSSHAEPCSGPPWFRLDGAQLVAVAADLAAPAADKMLTSLNVDSMGNYVGPVAAWSGNGVAPSDTTAVENYNDWTSSAATVSGRSGDANASTSSWWADHPWTCNGSPVALYCFEH